MPEIARAQNREKTAFFPGAGPSLATSAKCAARVRDFAICKGHAAAGGPPQSLFAQKRKGIPRQLAISLLAQIKLNGSVGQNRTGLPVRGQPSQKEKGLKQ